MANKRFFTDYPLPNKVYDGKWRQVKPIWYDDDKYVFMENGESFKLGYIHHGRPNGPKVTRNYARRHFNNKRDSFF